MAPLTQTIPEHLRPYVAEQDYSRYTAMDQAAWRFIIKISKAFFETHAHQKYCDGLAETGISEEGIPHISDMDSKLRRFGWRAIPVSGFIPPAVFMEFQSLGILPIASEMRTLAHLAYTPAPDIVHEAAGHAPILADPEYAKYLKAYGEVARKAIYSSKDIDVYEAIRTLSDTKEDPHSSDSQVAEAQKSLDRAIAANDYVSEATYLARMFWWTVEYGLVGSTQEPKIYGAGLLSSVSESFDCLGPKVTKLPLSLDCVNMSYDITRPQPQLFTAPDFKSLTRILEDFAERMAYRRGGIEGLVKAKTAGTVVTTVFDNGLQMSGTLEDFWANVRGEPIFLKFKGPFAFARDDQEVTGQGVARHSSGFSSPVGKVKTRSGLKEACELTENDLHDQGFKDGGTGTLRYESGIEVQGQLVSNQISSGWLTLKNCRMTYEDQCLYQPEWGEFDLALGCKVVSVFGGAADRVAFMKSTGIRHEPRRIQKTNLTQENAELNAAYTKVRALRDSMQAVGVKDLQAIAQSVSKKYSKDWLLRFELFELAWTRKLMDYDFKNEAQALRKAVTQDPSWVSVLERGFRAIGWQES